MPKPGRGLFTTALAALTGTGVGAGCSGQDDPAQIRALGDTPQMAAYFDAASIARTGDIVRVKVITVYNPATGGVQDGVHVSETTHDIDCAAPRTAVAATKDYDADGRPLADETYPDPRWYDLTPGSLVDRVKSVACTDGAVEKRPLVADYRADAAKVFRGGSEGNPRLRGCSTWRRSTAPC